MTTVAELGGERYVALTTFKHDGTPVTTAVWCVRDGDELLVWTGASTGKVKRIRRDPHVTVAPASASGKPRGDAIAAVARIEDDTDRVDALLAAKYRVQYRALRAFNAAVRVVGRKPAARSVTVAIRD